MDKLKTTKKTNWLMGPLALNWLPAVRSKIQVAKETMLPRMQEHLASLAFKYYGKGKGIFEKIGAC